MAPRRCGIRSKSQSLMQKTCLSGTRETLLACVESYLCMQVHACVCRLRVSFGLYFSKIDF